MKCAVSFFCVLGAREIFHVMEAATYYHGRNVGKIKVKEVKCKVKKT